MPPPLHRLPLYLWAAPTTLIGVPIALATLLGGGGWQWVDGVLEVHGGLARWFLHRVCGLVLSGGASAMTLGHIILGRTKADLSRTRAHERVHVRQCERWGPLFLPAYLLESVLCALRSEHAYRANRFEREAYEQSSPSVG